MKCIRSGLIAPGFSPNGLNFIWIVQYFLEMYFPDKTMPLTNGLPEIYWGPHGVMPVSYTHLDLSPASYCYNIISL